MGYFPIASKMHFINSIPTLTSSHDVIVFTSSSSVTLCSSEVQLSVSLSSSEVSSSSWKIVEKSRFRKVMNPENLHMQVWFDKWLLSRQRQDVPLRIRSDSFRLQIAEHSRHQAMSRLEIFFSRKSRLERPDGKFPKANLQPWYLVNSTSSRLIWQLSNFERW